MPSSTLREGLQFKKLDLHLHTPASACFANKTVTGKDIVNAALSAGLDGIAVTDHNSGAFIDVVKEAAKGTSLARISHQRIRKGCRFVA